MAKFLVHCLIEPFEPFRTGNGTVVVAPTVVESLGVDGLEGTLIFFYLIIKSSI
jgi:hypothetical protein